VHVREVLSAYAQLRHLLHASAERLRPCELTRLLQRSDKRQRACAETPAATAARDQAHKHTVCTRSAAATARAQLRRRRGLTLTLSTSVSTAAMAPASCPSWHVSDSLAVYMEAMGLHSSLDALAKGGSSRSETLRGVEAARARGARAGVRAALCKRDGGSCACTASRGRIK
jgi:hypothetical protein